MLNYSLPHFCVESILHIIPTSHSDMVDVVGMHKPVLDMRCSRALPETHFRVKGCHFYVALNTSWGDSASPDDAGL